MNTYEQGRHSMREDIIRKLEQAYPENCAEPNDKAQLILEMIRQLK
ncbi:hypothetical protein [Bradyrhizobium erythrophlei]|nr:hypothetical protein [Bradyrhizobium erythrophlei]